MGFGEKMKIKEKVLKEVERRICKKIDDNEKVGGDGIIGISDILKDVDFGINKTLAEVGKVIDDWGKGENYFDKKGLDTFEIAVDELKNKIGIK